MMDPLHPANGGEIDLEESFVDWSEGESTTTVPAPQSDFWGQSEEIEKLNIVVRPPIKPLNILEKLGPSPFERGSFPLIGFLATTFDKVSHFALERAGYQPQREDDAPPTDIPST